MIGIISGVVSAILIWFVVLIYNKLILPKIKELLYRGVNLEGEWYGELFNEEEVDDNGTKKKVKEKIKEITLTIYQSSYQISGDLVVKNIYTQNEVFSFYKYSGFIRDNFVVINYLPKSKKFIGLGSLILMVKEGGMSLSGNLSGTDTNKMTLIQYEDLYLKRK